VVVLGSLGALALSAMFCSGRRLGRMTPFFLGSGGLLALLTSRVVALPATVGWTGVSLFCLACILAGYSTKTKTVD
jgi:hypothetical protein